MKNRKDNSCSCKQLINDPRLQFTFDKKQTLVQSKIEISKLKFSSVNETTERMNLVTKRKSSRFSVNLQQKKTSRHQNLSSSSRADSFGLSNCIDNNDDTVYRYESIANLTEQQNTNLREQNTYLLDKLRRMYEKQMKIKKVYDKAIKYKLLWKQTQMQIQILKSQCQLYQDSAQEIKKIILTDVNRLRQKIMETQIEANQFGNLQQKNHELVIQEKQIRDKKYQQNKTERKSIKMQEIHQF